MKLYYHKIDGIEYLMDNYIVCNDGSREGVFEGSKYVVSIDGDITRDAELAIAE